MGQSRGNCRSRALRNTGFLLDRRRGHPSLAYVRLTSCDDSGADGMCCWSLSCRNLNLRRDSCGWRLVGAGRCCIRWRVWWDLLYTSNTSLARGLRLELVLLLFKSLKKFIPLFHVLFECFLSLLVFILLFWCEGVPGLTSLLYFIVHFGHTLFGNLDSLQCLTKSHFSLSKPFLLLRILDRWGHDEFIRLDPGHYLR